MTAQLGPTDHAALATVDHDRHAQPVGWGRGSPPGPVHCALDETGVCWRAGTGVPAVQAGSAARVAAARIRVGWSVHPRRSLSGRAFSSAATELDPLPRTPVLR